jgi:hypothetical protein
MAEQLTDPRIRSYVVSRFLSRLSQMPIAGKLIRLRDGYNVRWKLAEHDPSDPICYKLRVYGPPATCLSLAPWRLGDLP